MSPLDADWKIIVGVEGEVDSLVVDSNAELTHWWDNQAASRCCHLKKQDFFLFSLLHRHSHYEKLDVKKVFIFKTAKAFCCQGGNNIKLKYNFFFKHMNYFNDIF
jgi:hypothetical protein